jgi:hypothetical protein
MKKALSLIIILLITFYSNVKAQQIDPLKQNLIFNIDNLGDGHLEMSYKFTASQWDNFKKIMGANEDMLKRQMERALPAYYLQNFVYKEDAMNRTYTLSFDALGLARINDNGQWQIDMDIKNPDITKISDRNYALTATYNSQGTLIQQMAKLNIPDNASDIKQGKDAFGKAIFTYTLTPGHKGFSLIFLIAGILLIAAGAVAYLKPDLIKFGKKAVPYPFAPPAPVTVAAQATPVSPVVPPDPGQQAANI